MRRGLGELHQELILKDRARVLKSHQINFRIKTYHRNLTEYLHLNPCLRRYDSLIRSDDVIIGFSGLDLKENVILRILVDDLD